MDFTGPASRYVKLNPSLRIALVVLVLAGFLLGSQQFGPELPAADDDAYSGIIRVRNLLDFRQAQFGPAKQVSSALLGSHVVVAVLGVLSEIDLLSVIKYLGGVAAAFGILISYALGRRVMSAPFAFLSTLFISISFLTPPPNLIERALLVSPIRSLDVSISIGFALVAAFLISLHGYFERGGGGTLLRTIALAAVLGVVNPIYGAGLALSMILWALVSLSLRKGTIVMTSILIVGLLVIFFSNSLLEKESAVSIIENPSTDTMTKPLPIIDILRAINPVVFALAIAATPGLQKRHKMKSGFSGLLLSMIVVPLALSQTYLLGLSLNTLCLIWIVSLGSSLLACKVFETIWERTKESVDFRQVRVLLVCGLAAIIGTQLYSNAVQFGGINEGNGDEKGELERSGLLAFARKMGPGVHIAMNKNRSKMLSALIDVTVNDIDESEAIDLFEAHNLSSLRWLVANGVDVILVDRRMEDFSPWTLLDTPYFEPVFPEGGTYFKEERDWGDLDGDGIEESFRTLLPLGWRNAVIYPLTNATRSNLLTLRGYLDNQGTGPVIVRVNGIEVAALHSLSQQGGSWETFHIQVSSNLLRPVNKVYIENLDRSGSFHIESIGFDGGLDRIRKFYPFSAYRVLKLKEIRTSNQIGDVDGDGLPEPYDRLLGMREYPLYLEHRNGSDLMLRGFAREGTVQGLRIFINNALLVTKDDLGASNADRRGDLSAPVSYRIMVPRQLLRIGWNLVRLENYGRVPFFLQQLSLVKSGQDLGVSTSSVYASEQLNVEGRVTPGGERAHSPRSAWNASHRKMTEAVMAEEALDAIDHRTDANLGAIRLLGYKTIVSTRKVRYEFALFGTEIIDRDYELFIHFVSQTQPGLWFSAERKPSRTTKSWIPGQIYIVRFDFSLRGDDYDVYLGWRDPSTGTRLPVAGSKDDRLRLTPIRASNRKGSH